MHAYMLAPDTWALPLHTEEEWKRETSMLLYSVQPDYMAGGFHETADSTNLDHGCEVSQAMDRYTGSINDPGTVEHTRGIGRAWARTGFVGSPDACRWGHGDGESTADRLSMPPRDMFPGTVIGTSPSVYGQRSGKGGKTR
ncbi:uncharacterized protein LW93_1889 [Fusarium fujikuroi]|nr:uncharacterized protein LW93_1889 [Fusarium fujikuroi]